MPSGPLTRAARCAIFCVSRSSNRPARPAISTERRSMQIWPAIDLRGGKCVRLRQGDYQQETVFADDPAAVARQFADAGRAASAPGRSGRRPRRAARQSAERAGDPGRGRHRVRAGRRHSRRAIDQRAARLRPVAAGDRHVGTDRPRVVSRQCAGSIPGKLVLGIDARDGLVATDGWLNTSDVTAHRPGPPIRQRAAGRDHLHRHRHRRHAARAERRGDGRDAGGRRMCR